jgi:hypothetical protein
MDQQPSDDDDWIRMAMWGRTKAAGRVKNLPNVVSLMGRDIPLDSRFGEIVANGLCAILNLGAQVCGRRAIAVVPDAGSGIIRYRH